MPVVPRSARIVVALLLPVVAFFWLRGRFLEKFENWTGPAEWIWSTTRVVRPEPRAVVFVRSFRMAQRGRAELRLSGDREFVVSLNGRRIGGGRGGAGFPLRRWDVGDLLVPGENRLAVEVRSHDGVGGLVGSLAVEGVSESFVVTDGRWKVIDDWEAAIHPRARDDLAGWPAVKSWGRPPMNPWGYPKPGTLERTLTVPPGEPVALREVPASRGRAFVLDGSVEGAGLLVIRMSGRTGYAFDYAVRRSGEKIAEAPSSPAGSSAVRTSISALAVVPAGKPFWDSPGRVSMTGLWIGGADAAAVESVSLIPSSEPFVF